MGKRYMSYDGEGAEVGYLTLDEAREQYYDAKLDEQTGTITVYRSEAELEIDEAE